jgi:hypothetical protein
MSFYIILKVNQQVIGMIAKVREDFIPMKVVEGVL